MNEQLYRRCSRCVMDTTDPDITFDKDGVCNHCHNYDRLVQQHIQTGEAARIKLQTLVTLIRTEGADKKYDCVIGVSGGVDSTYLAYSVKQLGLRPLAVHLDNGWDSELAVANIHKVLENLDIDLYTHVIDWKEFKDLQLSFLKASTPDSEIPSDHAIVALMHQMALKIRVRHVIIGTNIRSESHHPPEWSQGHWDWKYIKSVHKKFGRLPLRTFPHMNFIEYMRSVYFQNWVSILNYLDYNKTKAMKVLENELGWKYYGGKHYESIYTRFYQGYILPKKFGYDKRKMHLSSLICSGETTREKALEELKQDPYPTEFQQEDKAYVIKKFELTDAEFAAIMNAPKKSYWDYPSYGRLKKNPFFRGIRSIPQAMRRILR